MAVSSATAQPPKPPPQPKAEAPAASADKKDATATAKPSQPSTQAPRSGIRTPDTFERPSGGRAQPPSEGTQFNVSSSRDARDAFETVKGSYQQAKNIIGGGKVSDAVKGKLDAVQEKFDTMQSNLDSLESKADSAGAAHKDQLSSFGKDLSSFDTELRDLMKGFGYPFGGDSPQIGAGNEGGAAGGIGEQRGLSGRVPAAGAAGGIAESPSSRFTSSIGSLAGLFNANFGGDSGFSTSGNSRGSGGSSPSQDVSFLDGKAGGSGGSRTLTVPTTDGSTISFHTNNGNGNSWGQFNFGSHSSGGGGAAGGIAERL